MPVPRRRPPFTVKKDGTFSVNLSNDVREFLASLADQLDEIVTMDIPEVRRLFPTAYPQDPERDAGYQVFARDQLIEQRKTAADTLRDTVGNKVLTEEELSQWMAVANDARLVLGTTLDVSEDDELDFDDPNFDLWLLYDQLGQLVHAMVTALTRTLPEPTESDPNFDDL